MNCYAYDFDLNVDQPVLSAAPGTIYAFKNDVNTQGASLGYGNYVVIQHPDGTCSRYGHMKFGTVPSFTRGQAVERGLRLGIVGNTGNTLPIGRGQHLHFARENCSTGVSLPTGFVETAGKTLANGASYTSHNDGCGSWGCAIQAVISGKYVSAEINRTGDGYGTLRARNDGIGTWERFRLVGDCRSAQGCAIQAVISGKYVSAEINRTGDGYGTLRARNDGIGTWERFRLQY